MVFNLFQAASNRNYLKQAVSVSILSLCLNVSVFSQRVFSENSLIALSTQEQTQLNEGRVVLQGEKGEYTARVLATGDMEQAWEVLTDYNNFKEFLPNIADSKIIEENGDRVIFEQVSLVDLLLLTKEFTVQIAANKTYLEKIDFEMIEGDLGSLNGRWEVEKLSDNQVLVTHRVTVAPKSQSEEVVFYGIYEDSLEETLQAIAVEIDKRSQ